MSNEEKTFRWTWACVECGGQDVEENSPKREGLSDARRRLGLRASDVGWTDLWCRASSAKTEEEITAARIARALEP